MAEFEVRPPPPALLSFVPNLRTCTVTWSKDIIPNATYEVEIFQGGPYLQKEQKDGKESKESKDLQPDPSKAKPIFRYEGPLLRSAVQGLQPLTEYWTRVRLKKPKSRALAGTVISDWTPLTPFHTLYRFQSGHHIECDGRIGRNVGDNLGVVPGDLLDSSKGVKGFECKFRILSLPAGGYISVGIEPAEPERLQDEDDVAAHLGFGDGIGFTNRGQIAKARRFFDHGEAFREGDIVGLSMRFGGPLQVSINGRTQKPIDVGDEFEQASVAFSLGKKGDSIECVEFALL